MSNLTVEKLEEILEEKLRKEIKRSSARFEHSSGRTLKCEENPILVDVPLLEYAFMEADIRERGGGEGLQSQPGLLEDTFHRTTQHNTDMKSARELVIALSNPDLKIRSVLLRILLDANASPAVLPPNNRKAVLLRILLDANASPAVLPPNNRKAVLRGFYWMQTLRQQFFLPAIGRQFSENPRSSSRSTEIQGLG
ncbi:hypothetical protein P5673_009232 [Acropora cervicornis]|uniref:Uncharacterized protein n=1 Tax=Acropora cervicornis TaxID=6130 RepID=A0AAD9V9U5_ACRCE|nr:hypothetical protein P5673_009232 [Acropora cervicornis]